MSVNSNTNYQTCLSQTVKQTQKELSRNVTQTWQINVSKTHSTLVKTVGQTVGQIHHKLCEKLETFNTSVSQPPEKFPNKLPDQI